MSTKNLNLPRGRVTKLCPKYLGPYKILEAGHKTSTYKLKLPPDLSKQQVHDVFHGNLLKPFIQNNQTRFLKQEAIDHYDFGNDLEQEWVVEAITSHKWTPKLITNSGSGNFFCSAAE